DARLRAVAGRGRFDRPVFPLLEQFRDCDPRKMLELVATHHQQTKKFTRAPAGDFYSFDNEYFGSPDAEIAYALVRATEPPTIVEIGSGHSTFLFREAIGDGGLATRLVSVDPAPRRGLDGVADEIIAAPVETLSVDFFEKNLAGGGILFVDSSHQIKVGGDVTTLILEVLPRLPHGVLIHFHDIFLPYDYPKHQVVIDRWDFTEQYMIQAILQDTQRYEVLWAGYYFQRTLKNFEAHFHAAGSSDATSLWLRKLP